MLGLLPPDTIHFNCYWDTPPYQFSTLWVIGSMLPRFCDRAATSANVLDSFKETGVRVEVTVTSRAAGWPLPNPPQGRQLDESDCYHDTYNVLLPR